MATGRLGIPRRFSLILLGLSIIGVVLVPPLSVSQVDAANKSSTSPGWLVTRVRGVGGQPLDAIVVVQGPQLLTGRTDAGGYYRARVPAGSYAVSALYAGATVTRQVTVRSGRVSNVSLALSVALARTPGVRQPTSSSTPSGASPSATTRSVQGYHAPRESAPGAPSSPDIASASTSGALLGKSNNGSKPHRIKSLKADPGITEIKGKSTLTAVVENPSGSTLSYKWAASGGTVSGSGTTATWSAPASAGTFTVTLTATDSRKRSASASVAVQAVDSTAAEPAPAPSPDPSPTSPDPAPAPSESRDPAAWPFASSSPWNYPIGSGAVYAPVRSGLTGGGFTGGSINSEYYTIATWVASPTDPVRKIYRKDRNMAYFTRRVPNAATPSKGTDGHMVVISPDHLTAFEMYHAVRRADGDWETFGAAVDVNLTGSGIRLSGGSGLTDGFVIAYGGSATAGVIRAGELRTGIKHALMFATDPKMWNRYAPSGRTYVWPASSADGGARNPEPGGYGSSGNLYMGSLVAIPAFVNITALGLETPEGLVLARALQNYGAYGVDSAGVGDRVVFRFDYAARLAGDLNALLSNWTAFQRDLTRLAKQLNVVTNSHALDGTQPSVPGGGGQRRLPLAPDFLTGGRSLLPRLRGTSLASWAAPATTALPSFLP